MLLHLFHSRFGQSPFFDGRLVCLLHEAVQYHDALVYHGAIGNERPRPSETLHSPALGKARASPELLPGLRAGLHRANHQQAAALGAFALGGGVVAALEVLHVLAVGGPRRRPAAFLQGAQQRIHLGLAEYRLPERLDVTDEPGALGHVGRHISFERTAADEGDDRVQVLRRNAERGLQRLEVLVVLPQRVLELEALLVELLRPLRLVLAAEDPAAHVLGFQHEHAEAREEHMVDLRRAVRGRQRHVVQTAIGLLVQSPVREQANPQLADIPLCPGRLQEAEQEYQRHEPDGHFPDLGDDGCEIQFPILRLRWGAACWSVVEWVTREAITHRWPR